MMFTYPYYGSPYYRKPPQYPYPYPYYTSKQDPRMRGHFPNKEEEKRKEMHCQKPSPQREKEKVKDKIKDDCAYFDILGIRLHFDDILIICLLFFLYKEGVKDQGLFISLILLLLS